MWFYFLFYLRITLLEDYAPFCHSVRYKEYMIFLILFSKLSDVLPAFTCESPIGKLLSICLGVNILSYLRLKTLQLENFCNQVMRSEILAICSPDFLYGNILLSKALKTFFLALRSITALYLVLWVSALFFFLDWFFWFSRFLKNVNIIF